MGQNTSIEWCTHTLNLWWGCVEVSTLCDNCYAREWAKRFDRAKWGAHEPRVAMPGAWKNLEKWQRDAAAAGRIDSVFCGSMMDIFEKSMALVEGGMLTARTTGDLRETLFNGIGHYPNLLFLFLTKRPQNIPSMVPASWDIVPPPNVMFGTSVGTRDGLGAIDALRRAPGRRFLSMEPLLEDVGLLNLEGIDWVIAGAESGAKARPAHPDWFRSLRDQCQAAGVAFFFKQWGEWLPKSHAAQLSCAGSNWGTLTAEGQFFPATTPWNGHNEGESGEAIMYRVGKKAAGRLLDGRTWDEMPVVKGQTPAAKGKVTA